MSLLKRKYYCRHCDDFSYVEDQKFHRIPIHTNNNTIPTEEVSSSYVQKCGNLLFLQEESSWMCVYLCFFSRSYHINPVCLKCQERAHSN